jgi:acyl carrier protein
MNDVHERLERAFRDVFCDDSLILRDEMTSRDLAGWDSIAHMNLMFTIESRFGMQFMGNELAEFSNIGELKRYLAGKSIQGGG